MSDKPNFATCRFCSKTMDIGNGCTIKQYPGEDGVKIDRIPFGSESWRKDIIKENPELESRLPEVCHDCNVTIGQFHHPGCDMEQCPECMGQYISCDCDLEQVDYNDQ